MNGVTVAAEQRGDDCQQLPAQGEASVPDFKTLSAPEEPALTESSRQSKCRYRCSVCGRDFSRPSRLADHMNTHSGEKPYSCSVCGKCFTKKINMVVHQRVHTGEKPYSCPDCGVSYAQPGCLRRHRLHHAAEKPYHCSVCGRGFIQRRYLVQHERIHTGERPYSCQLCPKRFASKNGLTDHQKTHREENLYSCLVCEKVFSTRSSFRDHTRLHTGQKPHTCSLCAKSFNRPGLLKKHVQKHEDGEIVTAEGAAAGREEGPHVFCNKDNEQLQRARRFVCDICGRGFSRASRLREHTRSHTGERPFQCDVCKKRFSVRNVYKRHRAIHNRQGNSTTPTPDSKPTLLGPDGQKVDEQPISDSGVLVVVVGNDDLNGLQELKVKEETCSLPDESPGGVKKLHSCSICGKGYRIPSRLQEHLKIHVMEKLHCCSECGKTFTTSHSLRAHQKTHMADKPHPCSICSKSFVKPCLLRQHMTIHIKDGLIADPADKEFWLGMKTVKEEETEEHLDEQDSEDLSTATESFIPKPRPRPGNCNDREKGEEDVSGLINSDGEEEEWKPAPASTSPTEPDGHSDIQAESGADGKSKHCCPVCGRDCFKSSALQKHLRIHSGERPFQCPTCKKSFTQHVHMTEHQRTHTGEKPYTCDDCGKSFTFSSALRRHQKVHTDARPYQCSICQKTFKQQCSLKTHQLTHSGVRYQCPLCSKSFSRALELTYHVDVHSDAQPYFCYICKKNLSGARLFRKHMKKHEAPNSRLPRAAAKEGAEPSSEATLSPSAASLDNSQAPHEH
ncbi:hypothetical protein Q5P01_011831 [Channa striata]|uniref:C2H2-type domain-containing protein n=1 Tax=Channa striata TaxID=64152 RepID=A0AA88SR62_CHASR|nr:hypothetical protein Q5P01_011831 [Channa striata]